MTLAAELRTQGMGKGVARKMRAQNLIPAVIYSDGTEAMHISLNPDELTKLYGETRNRNTIVDIAVDGDSIPCLLREVQRHPVKTNLLHVDFYRVSMKKPVEVRVPVKTLGVAAGMKIGGSLRIIQRELRVRCKYTDIPESITHDISDMNVGDMVRASELSVPKGCTFLYKQDFNVLTVYGKQAEPVVEEEETEAEESVESDE